MFFSYFQSFSTRLFLLKLVKVVDTIMGGRKSGNLIFLNKLSRHHFKFEEDYGTKKKKKTKLGELGWY